MSRLLIAALFLLGVPQLHAQAPTGQSLVDPSVRNAAGTATNTPPPILESNIPQSGVLRPVPDVTVDNTIVPPNVDPKMQIPAPVTPGSGVKFDPK